MQEVYDDYYEYSLSSPPPKDSNISVQLITAKSLLAAQNEVLQKVVNLLLIKKYQARALLIRRQWSLEDLMKAYADKGKEKLLEESGVSITKGRDDLLSSLPSLITCSVCFDSVSLDKAITMDCGHCFCTNCWTEYFKFQVEEGNSMRIKCMAHKCNIVCDEEAVRKLLKAKRPELDDRFVRHLSASYVDDNKRIKWCPSVPHCGNAIRVDGTSTCDVVQVECTCGQQFCFACSSQAHSPCTCAMWDHWSRKYEAESESISWIRDKTKECPSCHRRVEKIDGCDTMRCKCWQHFCWACGQALGLWKLISGHKCNAQASKIASKMDTKEFHRFNNCKRQYIEHKKSLAFEQRHMVKVKKRIAGAEGEVKLFLWLISGLRTLLDCRRVLCHTYPFAFCMFGDMCKGQMRKRTMKKKKKLFEDLQGQLELSVEKLSKGMEESIRWMDDESTMDVRSTAVLNLSTVTSNICEKLFECIEKDLLGRLSDKRAHNIAPYKSLRVHKASDLAKLLELSVVK